MGSLFRTRVLKLFLERVSMHFFPFFTYKYPCFISSSGFVPRYRRGWNLLEVSRLHVWNTLGSILNANINDIHNRRLKDNSQDASHETDAR